MFVHMSCIDPHEGRDLARTDDKAHARTSCIGACLERIHYNTVPRNFYTPLAVLLAVLSLSFHNQHIA